MGEYSKSKGEIGEVTIEKLFNLIGWHPTLNIDIACVQRAKHSCKTHGIDAFVTYISPLETDVADVLVCSTKFTNSLSNNEVLKYFKDLDNSALCAYNHELFNELVGSFVHTSRKTHLVLVLLTDAYKINASRQNMIDQIALDNSDLTIIDNERISFLYKAIEYAQREAIKIKSEFQFFYHSTGLNDRIERGRVLSGSILPIEFLSSDILPFKLINQENKSLLLCVKDSFDGTSFKRIVGLTQVLTSGWCNKVIICYPDYDLLKHKHIKQSVLASFYESNYANMVEVRNYSNQLINTIEDSVSYIAASNFNPVFSIENMLPYGDSLRQLLINSQINRKDMVDLLNKRGIILRKNLSKEDLIPYLTKSFISPNEFAYLRRKQAQAVGNYKGAVSSSYLTKDVSGDLAQAVRLAEPAIKLAIMQKLPNSPLAKSFTIDVTEDGSINIPFEIRNRNLSKDWTSMESLQKGEINFLSKVSSSDSKTRIMSTYESFETKQICKIVEREVLAQLKRLGLVPKKEKIQRISFGEFSRNNRNQFLLCFLEKIDEKSKLKFSQLLSIDFTLDEDSDVISEELVSLKNRLDELTLKGSSLEQIKFITDETYRESLIFYDFVGEYEFNYAIENEQISGKAEISFGFSNMKNKNIEKANKTEFEYRIKNIIAADSSLINERKYNLILLIIKEDFEQIKLSHQDSYLSNVQLTLFNDKSN